MDLVVVTAADRAAATYQRWVRYQLISGEQRFPKGDRKALWRVRRRVPHAARPRRLCQPPWTHATPSGAHPLSGGTNSEGLRTPNASRSSGGSAREELLSEKLPPSQYPRPPHFPRFFSFADLSASAAGMIFFVSVDDAACFFRLPPLRLFTLAAAAFKSNSCCQFCCASSSCCA